MRLAAPLEADPSAPLARVHPLAKLASAMVLMLALFVSADPLTPALVLGMLAVAFPLTGLPAGAFARRLLPLVLAAAGIAIFNTVFGARGAGIVGGIAAGLRLIGISAAGMMAIATIDPTDLADALVQHLRAPPRFVVGALAAWRLAPLFGQEWVTLGLARRARGIDAATPWGRIATFAGLTFALLVGAIRRATSLALAMDARGFGRRPCRTLARPRQLGAVDLAVVAVTLTVALGSIIVSVAVGAWRPLLAF